MSRGDGNPRLAFHEPEQRHRGAEKTLAHQIRMPLRCDVVGDRADNVKALGKPRAPFRDRRRALRRALRADDEHDGQPGERRKRCGRAGPALAAVEEPHHAFDDDDVRPLPVPRESRTDRVRRHRPRIEIDRRPAARRFEELRIDVVRPALRRGDTKPALPEGCDQTERYRGLAGMARRRSDDEAPSAISGASFGSGLVRPVAMSERIADEHAA